jgi:hypothetical protein
MDNKIITEFEIPVAVPGRLVKCRIEQWNNNAILTIAIPPEWPEDGHEPVRPIIDWRVEWYNWGIENHLSADEKIAIEQHIERLHKLWAFL